MKKLHYNTVSKTLTKCLKELMNEPLLKDFVLVGGTSLSLPFEKSFNPLIISSLV